MHYREAHGNEVNMDEHDCNENLQNIEDDSTINSTAGAESRTSEDTPNYAEDLKRQSDLIDKLIAQNESLTSQIATLIRNGANIHDGKSVQDDSKVINGQTSIDDFRDEFIPLEELGKKMFDKKERV